MSREGALDLWRAVLGLYDAASFRLAEKNTRLLISIGQ